MSTSFESSLPSDIQLLLRADAEQCWLHREVIPVLQQVEAHDELPAEVEEEVSAALAYLEAMWSKAALRACETDAAYSHLRAYDRESETLSGPAGRYHAAVRALRGIVADRVAPFLDPALDFDEPRERADDGELRVEDKRPGGCAPRAA
jgi:hypothetical protein